MNRMLPVPRYLGLAVLLAMAGFAAAGLFAIRRDVAEMRAVSQDNLLWTASQMEVELLNFKFAVSVVAGEATETSLAKMRERFDLLHSRLLLMKHGAVGESLRGYDKGAGSMTAIAKYLSMIDPVVAAMQPGDAATAARILREISSLQSDLRRFALRVARGEAAAVRLARDRIETSSETIGLISLAAIVISILSLALIQRENRRQQMLVELNRRSAEEAEQSSRAKSRFLTMMSHELRNPLHGVLGPLALLGQSDIPERQRRLVDQARQSGQSMLRMLGGLLDYGEMQDGRLQLKHEPFRVATLADTVRAGLAREGAAAFAVTIRPGTPEMVQGDVDRLRQIFVHLSEYVLEACGPAGVALEFAFDGHDLIGEISFCAEGAAIDWKLRLLMGLSDIAADQVSGEALRPLIARGLIAASRGILSLVDEDGGRRAIRVSIPSEPIRLERIRVHMETRSTALATIYQAALRSDRIVFSGPDSLGDNLEGAGAVTADVVLVDSTTVGEHPLMARLRARFPTALFVSLGQPQSPIFFDDIVETPGDMTRLRTRILGRLAS